MQSPPPVSRPDQPSDEEQIIFVPRRKVRYKALLGMSLVAVVGVIAVAGLMLQSNVFIAQKQDVRSEASKGSSGGGARSASAQGFLEILDTGVHDASTPLEPISYYDSLSNRTYVVWSGGAKTNWPAGSCHKEGSGENEIMVCFPKPYATSAMHVFVKYYDHNSKTWSSSQKVFEPFHKELYGDGHYRQSVLVDNKGYVHVFQTYHATLRPEECISVNPSEACVEVPLRHAVSKQANAINGWNVKNIPGTERNTHGYFFKSRGGHIYGIFRKTLGLDFEPDPYREYQTMIKSTDNGKSFTAWDAIIPDNTAVVSGQKLHTAYITGYQYDPERDGVHLVFSLSARQKHYLKHYYVFFNFENDSFYGPDGTNMGKDIAISDHTTLNTCCVAYDYGTLTAGDYDGKEAVVMLDGDSVPTIYFAVADRNGSASNKIIREMTWAGGKWHEKKLNELGSTHRPESGIYVNPDRKFLITLPVGNNTINPLPGMAESHIYQWDGATWSLAHNVKNSSLFYSRQQTREFMFAEGFRRDLSGFLINPHDSIFDLPKWTKKVGNIDYYEGLPKWTIQGYYEGPTKTKLFGFTLNELLETPVYNGDFEKRNLAGWPWSNHVDASVVNCDEWKSCSGVQGKHYLSLKGKKPEKGEYIPYLTSDYVDVRENLSEKSIKITFRAKVHSTTGYDGVYSGVFLRSRENSAVQINPITLTASWQTFTQTLKFPKTNSTTTKAQIVLNPIDKPFENPVYFDDIALEYLGKTSDTPDLMPVSASFSQFPSKVVIDQSSSATMQGKCDDVNSDLTECYLVRRQRPAGGSFGEWSNVGQKATRAGGTKSLTTTAETWTCYANQGGMAHEWVVEGVNKNGKKCTGKEVKPDGWVDCGEHDRVVFTCGVPITISAKGSKADGVWPILELHIKDTAGTYQKVASFTVSSTAYQDFNYSHPGPFQASQVRLKFVNDGRNTKTGEDRNVYIEHIKVAGTTYPTKASTTYSTGTWNPAIGSCRQGWYPGSSSDGLHCNGYFDYLSTTTLPNCSGVEITNIAGTCTGSGYKASVNWNAVPGASEYFVAYDDDNQFWGEGEKNEVGEKPTGAHTILTSRDISFNSDKTRYFRVRITKSSVCTPQNWLYGGIKTITAPVCSTATGAGAGRSSRQSSDDLVSNRRVVIRAKGVKSSNVWPKLELHIKDASGVYQMVKSFDIKSNKYKNYAYRHTTAFNASQVRLKYVNDAGARDVHVDYIKFGKAIYQTEAPTTYSTGTRTSSGSCTPGYHNSETLHCNGYFDFFK